MLDTKETWNSVVKSSAGGRAAGSSGESRVRLDGVGLSALLRGEARLLPGENDMSLNYDSKTDHTRTSHHR